MIRKLDDLFVLNTDATTYAFRVTNGGHLKHLYYGKRITFDNGDVSFLEEGRELPPGNTSYYSDAHRHISLEYLCTEMSSRGKGDLGETFIDVTFPDGTGTTDFLYEGYELGTGSPNLDGLPSSHDGGAKVENLTVTLKDSHTGLTLELSYFVYADCDVITRSSRVVNSLSESVVLNRLMSSQLDFADGDFTLHTFTGGWVNEMHRNDIPVTSGKYINSSITGTSSNRANPFVMLSKGIADEEHGDVYGLNLVYSGNHFECAEKTIHGKTRILNGINPEGFSFVLEPGDSFIAPESVMTFSPIGYGGMSRNMHRFVGHHILRGQWEERPRPVLLNSWEACYFDLSEEKILGLAQQAASLGAELFVLDDGWFGQRTEDTRSLGDWHPNPDIFPEGLASCVNKIRDMGIDFGIWVEPEMVNVDSDLYRAHPDWVIDIPGREHSEGRNQRLLDLTRTDVQDYIIEAMSGVFSSADISYIKWDMNRVFSDVHSRALPPERQGEVYHRYALGLYRVMDALTKKFPHILFEGCASGGGRTDLGMLCYFPQIWGSDNTDAICRADIQEGYSYGYPLSVISAHVSTVPNHQTGRITPMETRYAVASFGLLGYELDPGKLSEEELTQIKEQIATYKEWRDVYFHGEFYRAGSSAGLANAEPTTWTVVSPDKSRAIGMNLQGLGKPYSHFEFYKAAGLKPGSLYEISTSPSFDEGSEKYIVRGDALMNAGIRTRTFLHGTHINDEIRHYPDFAATLFYIRER